ncbi:hypothetical protein AVEN_133940-1 [Araneus ventricosus]|uniref:Uncharacterized protein n=1 Tax=Araneus ventricosus TaxID=182803 RepID=A0A4Y2D3E0_ARAVE|nr:hypothetical protein AVEN_133940-1 [Araneus ventricosus]
MAGLSTLISPFNDHSFNRLLPISEQQPAEIRPTSIEVAWAVTAGLGVRVLCIVLYLFWGRYGLVVESWLRLRISYRVPPKIYHFVDWCNLILYGRPYAERYEQLAFPRVTHPQRVEGT